MIDFTKRSFTATQGDIKFIKLGNISHVTAHLPSGLVTKGATKMRFKSRTWSFDGNSSPAESWLYDYSGPTLVEIDLVDTVASIVLPDEVGKSPGFLPVLTDNAGNTINFGVDSYKIYFSIKVDSIR